MIVLRVVLVVLGILLIVWPFLSAARTFVVPRSQPQKLNTFLFRINRRLFDLLINRQETFEQKDRVMALYAPLTLLMLVPFWLLLTAVGYSFIYWSMGVTPWTEAFITSGSSLLTLGYASFDSFLFHLLSFSEAVIGLMLVAMLIAYLPTMYSAVSRRERAVALLEVRAGWPPTAPELLWRLKGMDMNAAEQKAFWNSWEEWFTEIDETHTSLPALAFFRSPRPNLSWVVSAGVVLDGAALALSLLEDDTSVATKSVVIRAGFLALRRIADSFNLPYDPDPHFPENEISVTRAEFDAACKRLAAQGLPLKEDLDLAWQNFGGWRVNYDETLAALAQLTMAPETPWLGEMTLVRADPAAGETGAQLVSVEGGDGL
jgi:hypothetical protein